MKIFKFIGISLLAGVSLHASANNLDELSKDINIMSSILETAFKQQRDKDGTQVRDLSYTYLHGQGVVFTVSTRSSNRWPLDAGLVILDEVLPAAPVAPDVPFLDNDEFSRVYEEAIERARHALSDVREELYSVREQAREVEWEIRENEREKRDLEFELRHADKQRQQEIRSELEQLSEQMATLKKSLKEVESRSEQARHKREKEVQEHKANAIQQRKRFLAAFESTLADVLCKYSAGLRSMGEGEHVSFVLTPFADPQQQDKRNRIYVFENKHINACLTGRIDGSELLKAAKAYHF